MAVLAENQEQRNGWRESFIQKFRENNESPSSFHDIVKSHSLLSRQNRALKLQKESCEKQLLILQHEHAGSAADKVVGQLEEKIRSLQDEVIALGKANSEMSDLRYRLLQSDKNMGDITRALESLQRVAARDKAEKERLQAIDGVLQNELDLVRSMLSKKEEECEGLRVEKNNIVMRLLEDKASMVSEMNQMNDMVESLNKKLEDYKRREASGELGSDFDNVSKGEASASNGGEGGSFGVSVKSSGWSLDTVSIPPTTLRHKIKAHHTEANAVVYSESEPLLFTGSSDGTVKVWEVNTARSRATLRGSQPILTLDSFEHYVAAGSTDRTVKIFDLRTERLRTTITGHSNKVHAVKYTPDGRQLISGSTDRTIKIWDSLSGRELRTLRANSTCNAIDISRDGSTCVSGHQDGSVRIWDIGSGQQMAEMITHVGQVTSATFSPRGGMQVLTSGRDNQLALLDSRTLEPIVKVSHPSLRIGYNWSRCQFSPDGCFIVAGSLNGSVLIFDAAEGGGQSSMRNQSSTGNSGNKLAPDAGGGGRFGGFGEAFGNALGNALGKTNLGNTIGNTLGGTLGSTMVSVSAEHGHGITVPTSSQYNSSGGGGVAASGIRCHSQLREHETAVTTTAWSSGAGGWHQVASVDKQGNLFIWD